MPTGLINANVLIENTFRDDLAVVLDGGYITAVLPTDTLPNMPRIDLEGDRLIPGFIDLQVNGGGGVLFNDAPTMETIERIGRAHRQFGTLGFLPTLISDDLETIDRAMRAVEAAMEARVPGVLGIHIEGPFINAQKRGVHSEQKLRQIDAEAIALLSSLKCGKTLVTLAPEITGVDAIRQLADNGVKVSLGHSTASFAQSREAFSHGATGVTHLFNCMPPMQSREPGLIGAFLETDNVWGGIIVDGFHVAPEMLRIAMRAKPFERFMLVSDAMPSVGSSDSGFSLYGNVVHVEGGRCVDTEGRLAGAHLHLLGAVENCISLLGLPEEQAVYMATAAPAEFLGLAPLQGRIEQGANANLLRLGAGNRIVGEWFEGRYQKR